MDACYTQSAPAAETGVVSTRQWLHYAPAAVIVVGLAWRLVRYIGQFPIWGDEAMLLLNILDRDYAELTQHLRFCQVAPLLFLWGERTALLVFGSSEWSMHLFPVVMGLTAFVMFWRLCQASFAPAVAGLAIAILAVSYYPVRHGCEVKPYAFDLCFAVLYLWMALARLRNPDQSRWLVALVVVTPIAVFSSYPSVFVGGAVSLVLLPGMRTASWTQRGLYALFNLLLVGSFVIHYTLVGQHGPDAVEADRARAFLHNYWRDAFPPDAVLQWPLWLVQVFTGNMLAYPLGANRGGSTVTSLLVLLGSIALWRSNQRAVLALCWLPFALNLLASILGKYPFGGSARITQHLAPFICVLMAHGLGQILDWVRSPNAHSRLHLAAYVFLLVCGVVGIVRDITRPYKTEHDRDVRQLAQDLAKRVGAKTPVVLCHTSEKAVLAEYQWYLRTAPFDLHWLPESSAIDPAAKSCWLVLCGHQELSVAEVTSAFGPRVEGWRVAESDVRLVPPENAKMATVYCRWVRLVRD
jgi:hypothetical protein